MKSCNGFCDRFSVAIKTKERRYSNGKKYCSTCGAWFDFPASTVRCPCCSNLLRTKARTQRNKKNLTVENFVK
jgi:DNA-directed RNA polymerase subunit RPC12/RpoP